MLTKLGCIVDTADDGQQFLDILQAEDARTYDLITLDNYMPVLSGEDAVRELRAKGRSEFVVGCTGNALTEDQTSYIAAGADRVLTKPIMLRYASCSWIFPFLFVVHDLCPPTFYPALIYRDLKDVLEIARTRREQKIQVSSTPAPSRLP